MSISHLWRRFINTAAYNVVSCIEIDEETGQQIRYEYIKIPMIMEDDYEEEYEEAECVSGLLVEEEAEILLSKAKYFAGEFGPATFARDS